MKIKMKVILVLKRYFTVTNLTKYFTCSNLIVAIIDLAVVGLFKFTGLSVAILALMGINISEYKEYIISGFFSISSRFGAKGIVEAILADLNINIKHKIYYAFFSRPMSIQAILNPEISSPNPPLFNQFLYNQMYHL